MDLGSTSRPWTLRGRQQLARNEVIGYEWELVRQSGDYYVAAHIGMQAAQ